MRFTQLAVFEVGVTCNRSEEHKDKCPCASRLNRLPGTVPMTDGMIIDTACRLYADFGFNGMVAWHYYNEPLLEKERVFSLCEAILNKEPKAKFMLFTNGDFIMPEDVRLKLFTRIHVTNFSCREMSFINDLAPDITWRDVRLDDRMTPSGPANDARCRRMFNEIVFDFFGNCHICCVDWELRVKPGSLFTDKLSDIVERFVAVRNTMAHRMLPDAPSFCQTCWCRQANFASLAPWVVEDTCQEFEDAMEDFPSLKLKFTPSSLRVTRKFGL